MLKKLLGKFQRSFFLLLGLFIGQPLEYFIIHNEIFWLKVKEFFIRIQYSYNLYKLRNVFKLRKKFRYILYLCYIKIFLYFKMSTLQVALIPKLEFLYDIIYKYQSFILDFSILFEPAEASKGKTKEAQNYYEYYRIQPGDLEEFEERFTEYIGLYIELQTYRAIPNNFYYHRIEVKDFENMYKQYSVIIAEDENFKNLVSDINLIFDTEVLLKDIDINFEMLFQYFILNNKEHINEKDISLFIDDFYQKSYLNSLNLEQGITEDVFLKDNEAKIYYKKFKYLSEDILAKIKKKEAKIEELQRKLMEVDDPLDFKAIDQNPEFYDVKIEDFWELAYKDVLNDFFADYPLEELFIYYGLNGFYYIGTHKGLSGTDNEQQFGIWNFYKLRFDICLHNKTQEKFKNILYLRWLCFDMNKKKKEKIFSKKNVNTSLKYHIEFNKFIQNFDEMDIEFSVLIKNSINFPNYYSGIIHFIIRNIFVSIFVYFLYFYGLELIIKYRFPFSRLFPDRWELVEGSFIDALPYKVQDILPEVFCYFFIVHVFFISLILILFKSARFSFKKNIYDYVFSILFILSTLIHELITSHEVYGFEIWWELKMSQKNPLYVFLVNDDEHDLIGTMMEGYSSAEYNYEEAEFVYEYEVVYDFVRRNIKIPIKTFYNEKMSLLKVFYYEQMAPIVLDWYFGFFCVENEINKIFNYLLENKSICGYLAFYTIFLVVFYFVQLLWWLFQQIK